MLLSLLQILKVFFLHFRLRKNWKLFYVELFYMTEADCGLQTQHLKNDCDFRAAAVPALFLRARETNRHFSGN